MLGNLFLSSYLEEHISKGKIPHHSLQQNYIVTRKQMREQLKQGNFDFSCVLLSTKMCLTELSFDNI